MIRHFKNKKNKKLTRKKKLRLTAVQASVRFLTLFSYHSRAGYTDRKYTNFDSLLRYDAHRSHQETYFLSFRLWTWFFPCFVFRFNLKNWRKPVVLVSYQRHWVEQYVDLSSTRDANDTVNEHRERERHTPGRRDQSVWQLLLFLSFHFVFFLRVDFLSDVYYEPKKAFFFFFKDERKRIKWNLMAGAWREQMRSRGQAMTWWIQDTQSERKERKKKKKWPLERDQLTFKSRVEGSPVVSSGCHWATSPPCRVSLRGLDAKGKGQFTIAAMEGKRRRLGRYRISSSLPVSIIITFYRSHCQTHMARLYQTRLHLHV